MWTMPERVNLLKQTEEGWMHRRTASPQQDLGFRDWFVPGGGPEGGETMAPLHAARQQGLGIELPAMEKNDDHTMIGTLELIGTGLRWCLLITAADDTLPDQGTEHSQMGFSARPPDMRTLQSRCAWSCLDLSRPPETPPGLTCDCGLSKTG